MIVITGVTGHTGKVAAEALLARGEKVRVVVRDAAKGAQFAAKGAEVAVADLSDTNALTKAFAGARSAYVLLPPNMAVADFRGYQRELVASIAGAVRAARVPHVVLLSSIGADLPAGNGPIAGLYEAETALRAIEGTSLTAMRPGYFHENLATWLGQLGEGKLGTFFPANAPIAGVGTKEIGALAATLLLEGPRGHEVVELAATFTPEDVADAIGRVTGKRPTVAVYPVAAMSQTLQSFGFPVQLSDLYQEMTEGFTAGKIHSQAGQPGVRAFAAKTPIDDVLRTLLVR